MEKKPKNALILFTKNAQLGHVKTRLAKTVGAKTALAIYKKLLLHTKNVSLNATADKFLFYSKEINTADIWENELFDKKLQKGNDLGIRMQAAFDQVFQLDYHHVCIIGSDCYDLNTDIINKAFNSLVTTDFVIGPTFDGGYYLLGMKKLYLEVFLDIEWSTETVFESTISKIKKLNKTITILEKLTDIDEEKDLPEIWKSAR